MNIFTKVILIIIILLLPIVFLFTYSNQESIKTIEEQIDISNNNRMAYFMDQLDASVNKIMVFPYIIFEDPDIIKMQYDEFEDRYDYYKTYDAISQKINMFSMSNQWMNRIVLHFPLSKNIISTTNETRYNEEMLLALYSDDWFLVDTALNRSISKDALSKFIVPRKYRDRDPLDSPVVVEINIFASNLVEMLNIFKENGQNDPFLIDEGRAVVFNDTADHYIASRIMENLEEGHELGNELNNTIMTIDRKDYLVTTMKSPEFQMVLVDYVPLEEILSPVTRSRNFFYITTILLLVLALLATTLIYYHVQKPIHLLNRGVGKLRSGFYSTRIRTKSNRDFDPLFQNFNDMASEIQHLIERVYTGEIQTREAMMKQLQSQVNPHFLYNSFAYMISMAKMNNTEAIIAMSHCLADFYKYTTRNDVFITSVKEEIQFAQNYLDIIQMQLPRISYTIDLDSAIERVEIPRLLIQPLVENAILHGLEPKLEDGEISIIGRRRSHMCSIIVEDNGVGVSPSQLLELRQATERNENEEIEQGYGLWNVNQRLKYHFGEEAKMMIEHSPLGGLRVELQWAVTDKEADHVYLDDRR